MPNCKINLTDSPFLKLFLKKTKLLKQFYDKLILPEMPGGIIDQKKIFRNFFFLPKNGYFFLKKPFLTTKRAQRLQQFGPKLPPGLNKNCVKIFCSWHFSFRCGIKKYDKYDTNMTTNMTDMNNKYDWKHQKITKNYQNRHKSPPTPTNQSICTINMIFSHYMHQL